MEKNFYILSSLFYLEVAIVEKFESFQVKKAKTVSEVHKINSPRLLPPQPSPDKEYLSGVRRR